MIRKNDGKIRTRCQNCGKRVKFPANMDGEAFRCPVCHKVMVAPLDGSEIRLPRRAELLSAAARLKPEQERSKRRHHGTRAEHPVQRFGHSLQEETLSLARHSCEILADPELTTESKIERLSQLRRTRRAHLREQAVAITADLEQRIESIRNSPASDTLSNKRNIAVLESQLFEMKMYLRIMLPGVASAPQRSAASALRIIPREVVAPESPVGLCDMPNPA